MMRRAIYGLALIALLFAGVGVGFLLSYITRQQLEAEQYPLQVGEIAADEVDPEVWGLNFPLHYDRFMMTQINSGQTPYGGSDNYDKIDQYPAKSR